jgi:glycosyltransferase involved in cell wall biosynthesis
VNLLVFNIRVDADHPTQAVTTRWLSALSPHFKRIFVITIHKGRLQLPANVEVYSITDMGAVSRAQQIINLYRVVIRLLCKEKIDASFIHQAIVPGAMAAPMLKLWRIPTVLWYCHSETSIALKISHYFADKVISASLQSCPIQSNRLVATGHGIDTDFFSPCRERDSEPAGKFLIVSISRFAPIKRIEVLFDAIHLIVKNGMDQFSVHIYGFTQTAEEKKYLNDLKLKAVHLELSDHIVWKGRISNWDVPSILCKADLFVSQQVEGGIDKAILEAMSCEVPVLLTNDACVSIFPQRYKEKLVFFSGHAEEMAAKLHNLMTCSENERYEMGQALRDIVVRKHSVVALAEKIKCIMDELVGRIAA